MSINTTDLLYKAVLRGKTGLARPRANSYAAKLATSVALFAVVAFCGPAEAGFFEDLFGGGTQTPIAGPMHTSRPQASRRVDHVRRVEHVWRAAARPATSAAELKPAPVTLTKATWAAYKAPAAARPLFFSKDAQPRRPLFCSKDDNSSKVVEATQALMQDPTLQRGDAVVTDEGVRVFEGRKVCPHPISEFRTLAETRALAPGARTTLVEIERDLKTKNIDHADRPIVATDVASNSRR